MKSFKFLILTIALTIAFYSCKKEGSTSTVTALATIRNTNTALGSGCGYLIENDGVGTGYSPTNLTDAFKPTDTLHVVVTYSILNSTHLCGPITGAGYREVNIIDIKRR